MWQWASTRPGTIQPSATVSAPRLPLVGDPAVDDVQLAGLAVGQHRPGEPQDAHERNLSTPAEAPATQPTPRGSLSLRGVCDGHDVPDSPPRRGIWPASSLEELREVLRAGRGRRPPSRSRSPRRPGCRTGWRRGRRPSPGAALASCGAPWPGCRRRACPWPAWPCALLRLAAAAATPGIPGMPGHPAARANDCIILRASKNRSTSWLTSETWRPEPAGDPGPAGAVDDLGVRPARPASSTG